MEYIYKSFKYNTPSILNGLSKVFDFFPKEKEIEDDQIAITNDWRLVGNDLNDVMHNLHTDGSEISKRPKRTKTS